MCRARVIVVDAGVNSELNAAAPVSHLSDERAAAAAAADPKIAFPGNVHANHSRIFVVRIQMSIYQCGKKEQNRMIFLAAHSLPPLPSPSSSVSITFVHMTCNSPLQRRAPLRRGRDRQRERQATARTAHVRGQSHPPVSC